MKVLLSLLLLLAAFAARADVTWLRVDARAPVPEARSSHLHMGASRAPDGRTLSVDSRQLTLAGQPWLPVMGEMHYSRVPPEQWATQLAKMKSAGVDIVASYVIWSHHEASPGQFNWQAGRDLRRFVLLAQQAGLKVVARIGPWVHAEVRYGGLPTWLVQASIPLRGNDPAYLAQVERLYGEIGRQLRGLLWKDGGPVVGVQLENEYNLTGPGQGREHIAKLKQLGVAAGLDVPLYTVTGWDHTIYPRGEVLPVFGGYADEPWKATDKQLPPHEVYAFRFDSRVSGDLGSQTQARSRGDAEGDAADTPFLGAEYGGGVPAMYRRRPLMAPADIAALAPVQLGSGVNLLGWYMFHGGRNPGLELEETIASGGYNDTPALNYDFQAPLGADGDERPVLRQLRPYHLFARHYGHLLAPMSPRAPQQLPASTQDLSTPRWALRARGDSGFLFVSNHVRQHATAPWRGVRFELQLPSGVLQVPSSPIDVPTGAHFIWPVNLPLEDGRLVFATAQPVAQAVVEGVETHVFAAQEGIPVELQFAGMRSVRAPGARVEGGRVTALQPGLAAEVEVETQAGRRVRFLVLTRAQAEGLLVAEGPRGAVLITSPDEAWLQDGRLQLRRPGEPVLRVASWPGQQRGGQLAKAEGRFSHLQITVPAVAVPAIEIQKLRNAQALPPAALTGPRQSVVAPAPELYGRSAAWRLRLPTQPPPRGVAKLWLELDVAGDVARLYRGLDMVDDHYDAGPPWRVALGSSAKPGADLVLTVLPLRPDTPIYFADGQRPRAPDGGPVAELRGVRLVPEYAADLSLR